MAKATTRLTPRQVIGNCRRSLSLEEASAALVALLSGDRSVPPPSDLRRITKALRHRQVRSSLQVKEARNG
jgi:hypothetical protein